MANHPEDLLAIRRGGMGSAVSRRILRISLFLGLGLSSQAVSRLPPVSYQEFRQAAPCGFLVRVEDVREDRDYVAEFEAAVLKGESPEVEPNIEAILKIEAAVGDELTCLRAEQLPSAEFSMWFYSAVHSSHPNIGDYAVVFPERVSGRWMEAVYGRSYWVVQEQDGRCRILVNWRTDFLAEEFDTEPPAADQSSDVVFVSLRSFLDQWGLLGDGGRE